jgi:hypothetical protein
LPDPKQITDRCATTTGVGDPTALTALGRIVGQASWAIVDQALFSFSTFGTNLVLALWVTPAEYGGYMAASAAFWLAASIYDGLIAQPMAVFGSGRFHDRPAFYLPVLMVFHWCSPRLFRLGWSSPASP